MMCKLGSPPDHEMIPAEGAMHLSVFQKNRLPCVALWSDEPEDHILGKTITLTPRQALKVACSLTRLAFTAMINAGCE